MKTLKLTQSVRTLSLLAFPLLAFSLLVSATMLSIASNSYADDHATSGDAVRIPVGQTTQVWQGETPRRGLTKAQVEAKFGEPATEEGPSGTPPIYFWEYPDFTVYFEGNHVIHTVVKTR